MHRFKTMETLFYSPDGSSWCMKDEEIHLDKSCIVTMTVRRYTYNNMDYAILVCADMKSPLNVFYTYEVRNPHGVDLESVPEKDFRIIKRLLQYAPISQEVYSKAEQKLQRKIDKQLQKKCIQGLHNKAVYKQETSLPITKAACSEVKPQVMPRNNLTMCCHQHCRPNVRMNEFAIESYFKYCIQRSICHQTDIIRQLEIIHNAVFMMDVSNIITARLYSTISFRTIHVSHGRQLRNTSEKLWKEQTRHLLKTSDSVTRNQFEVTDTSNDEFTEQIKEAMGTTGADQENVNIDDVDINDDNKSIDSIDAPNIDAADDDYLGGVMGVYCRSSIHGDYSGCVSLGE